MQFTSPTILFTHPRLVHSPKNIRFALEKIFKQTDIVVMRSPLSPTLAEVIHQKMFSFGLEIPSLPS